MSTFLDTLFLADVVGIAVGMHLIARCVADDSEKRRLRRREMYRQQSAASDAGRCTVSKPMRKSTAGA